jgi:hypothetical protein
VSHAEHEHPNPNLQDDPSVSPMVLGSILGVLLVVVTIYAVTALYFRTENVAVKEHVYDPTNLTVQELQARQTAEMTRYRWTDPKKDWVGIPIDDAIELTARELAAGQKK